MAIYRCGECDHWRDDDHFPCEEHPKHDNELICPDCVAELPDTPEIRQKGQFTAEQLEIIKKLEEESEDY